MNTSHKQLIPLNLAVVFIAAGTFSLSPAARAVTPTPDGDYGYGNTAEGAGALFQC